MDEKKRILIVDDVENICRSLQLIFGHEGYETETVGTGREALEKVQGKFFNLVLLDIKLPDMAGVELVTPLKEMHPDMVVMMMTAYVSLETAVQAQDKGASAYIMKPFKMEEVLVKVREALEKQHLVIERRRLHKELQRELAERKQVEAALQESEAQLRAQYKGIPLPTYTWKQVKDDFVLIDYNNAAETITAGNVANVLGKTAREMYHDRLEIQEDLARCVKEQTLIKREIQYQFTLTGQKQLSVSYVYVPPDLVMVHTDDITERKQAEEALRVSEERFRQFFEHAPEYCYMISPENVILDVNKAALKTLGYTKENLVGKSLETIYAPEYIPKMKRLFAKWKQTGEIQNEEMEIITINGTRRKVILSAGAIRDTEGRILHSVSMQMDITARKRVEEALQESEAKYSSLVENAKDGVVIVQDGAFQFANRAMAELSGYKVENIMGKPFIDLIAPESRHLVSQKYFSRLEGEKVPGRLETKIQCKDETSKDVELTASMIKYNGLPAAMGIVRDITERKRVSEEIRQLNQYLESIIDNANVWLDVLDENANVVIWNKAAEEISGYSREEVIGHDKIWEWLYPDEAYRTAVFASAATIIEGEEIDKGDETTIRCKDGQLKIISWYSRNLVDEEGTPIGSIALGRDITERKQAEAALRESEEKYRTILETMDEGYYEVDLAGNFTFFNDSLCRLFGFPPDELMGMNNRQYLDEETAKVVYKTFNEVYRTGKSTKEFGWEIIRKDGTRRFVEASVSLLISSTGEPTGFRGIVRDITARKRAEEALQESENKFRRTFEAIPDPAYLWERQSNSQIILTAANKAALELSEGKITNFLGTELESPNISHSFSGLGLTLKYVLDTGETQREEICGRLRTTGEEQWFLVDFAKTAEDSVLLITKDITKRKQAEETLARARDRLTEQVAEKTRHILEEKNRVETIIETIPEGLLVFDTDGTLSLANKTVKEYYWNLFHEELPVGYNCLKREDNLFLETVKKIYLAQKGEVIMIEPKSGLHLQFSSAMTRVPGELPFGTIIEVRDISPFINFDTMRKQFVSSVSHELRTPISAIVQSTSNIEKYKKKLSEEQQDKLLNIISRNAKLMARLIDDLLLVSRIDEHRITVELKRYRPLEILQNVLTELESRRKAKEITIEVDVDKEIQLVGDHQKIGQIFRIFLDNALKYSNEQTTIKIKAIDHYKGLYNPQERDGVLIHFHDSGRGIRKKDLPYLFERFFRSEDVRDIPGTGLGLAIAQELTGFHEGEIFVESEFGKGSTFSVFLPRLTKSLKASREERARI